MVLGILKESPDKRVALVPATVKKVRDIGLQIMMENGAGEAAGFPDVMYGEEVKCTSREEVLRHADILSTLSPPSDAVMDALRPGTYLISSFEPYIDDTIVDRIRGKKLKAFSMDMIPRTTLAQSMDVLSSMASIAGYKAVLEGANLLNKYFPMMITAAGSIKPAKVLVIGAGVAGLQAIATAKRLGSVVEAFDTRSAVREEVESLGGKFVEVEGAVDDAAAGGYAVEQTAEYMQRQQALVQEKARTADVIITTAQVRGREAPKIILNETVEQMKPGSVIIDLAASTGGNCALTENNRTVIKHGVIIVGNSNLAGDMPLDASFLYSNNVFNFLKTCIVEGQVVLNMEDEIIASAYITKDA